MINITDVIGNKVFIGLTCILLFTFTMNEAWAKKKECQPYYTKLMNIQSQQKIAHTRKKGESLTKKENKARKKWWDCEQGKLSENSFAKKIKKTPKVIPSKVIKKFKKSSAIPINVKPFQTSQPIVIKNSYKGEKQEEWTFFYKIPQKCIKPKNYRLFVWCVEDKKSKNKAFEKYYASKALSN